MKPTLVVLALLLFSGFSKADTTYDYVGTPFTSFNAGSSPCAPHCNVTGQLVVAQPFAPNTITTFDLAVNPPINFSFSTFGFTISPTSGIPGVSGLDFIQIGTDAAGLTNEWEVQILTSASMFNGVQTTVNSNLQFDNVPQFKGDTFNFNNGAGLHGLGAAFGPGTWTEEKPIGTPEPSSVLSLAIGLGLLALLAKRAL